MAYTICDEYGDPKPIRILLTKAGDDTPYVGQPFTPCWWVCDPCNPVRSRYEVTFRSDAPAQPYPWYQVVTSDDSESDVTMKVEYYAKVIAARRAADLAQREYERLNGGR